jgi:TonB-dependent SusC/RagA subfamily outer membrane receptor
MPRVIFLLQFHPQRPTLVFSFTGHGNTGNCCGEQTTIAVQLKSSVGSLNEVVVIGYGTARKSDLTVAVATVRSGKLLDKPVANVSQALQGKVPGVDVSINTSAPGEAAKVRIRGISSINSSLDPLYVVDGVIGVNANLLNPDEIASLEVLKDASSTAIYGARGANGVIIITTKRGIKGKPRVSFDSYVSHSSLQRHLEALDANEFMQVYNLAYANAAKYDSLGYAQGNMWLMILPIFLNYLMPAANHCTIPIGNLKCINLHILSIIN